MQPFATVDRCCVSDAAKVCSERFSVATEPQAHPFTGLTHRPLTEGTAGEDAIRFQRRRLSISWARKSLVLDNNLKSPATRAAVTRGGWHPPPGSSTIRHMCFSRPSTQTLLATDAAMLPFSHESHPILNQAK